MGINFGLRALAVAGLLVGWAWFPWFFGLCCGLCWPRHGYGWSWSFYLCSVVLGFHGPKPLYFLYSSLYFPLYIRGSPSFAWPKKKS